MRDDLFLGVDGGQSRTKAVIADENGTILGRGHGGPSNHADEPGGRERLEAAVGDSVGEALRAANLQPVREIRFASVHCGMTGGASFKEEVIRSMLRAGHMSVGHDAPAALAGATGCKPGIIVIAGTGSVVYGEKANGTCVHAGGWGYLFGDEGSGFRIALEAVRQAAKAQDGLCAGKALLRLTLDHFKVADLQGVARAVYSGQMTRDNFAVFAREVHDAAASGVTEAGQIIEEGTESLAESAAAIARKLQLSDEETHLYCAGGMFNGALFRRCFESALRNHLPNARILAPRFEPVIGALLLAYRAAEVALDEPMLSSLDQQCRTAVRGERGA